MIAAVHLDPRLTVPAAALVAAALAWHWIRLGRPGVPAGRRRVRRLAAAVALVALPVLVAGSSFLDPAVQKRPYVMTWSAAFLLVLAIIAIAGADALLSVRRLRRSLRAEARQALDDARTVAACGRPRATGDDETSRAEGDEP